MIDADHVERPGHDVACIEYHPNRRAIANKSSQQLGGTPTTGDHTIGARVHCRGANTRNRQEIDKEHDHFVTAVVDGDPVRPTPDDGSAQRPGTANGEDDRTSDRCSKPVGDGESSERPPRDVIGLSPLLRNDGGMNLRIEIAGEVRPAAGAALLGAPDLIGNLGHVRHRIPLPHPAPVTSGTVIVPQVTAPALTVARNML